MIPKLLLLGFLFCSFSVCLAQARKDTIFVLYEKNSCIKEFQYKYDKSGTVEYQYQIPVSNTEKVFFQVNKSNKKLVKNLSSKHFINCTNISIVKKAGDDIPSVQSLLENKYYHFIAERISGSDYNLYEIVDAKGYLKYEQGNFEIIVAGVSGIYKNGVYVDTDTTNDKQFIASIAAEGMVDSITAVQFNSKEIKTGTESKLTIIPAIGVYSIESAAESSTLYAVDNQPIGDYIQGVVADLKKPQKNEFTGLSGGNTPFYTKDDFKNALDLDAFSGTAQHSYPKPDAPPEKQIEPAAVPKEKVETPTSATNVVYAINYVVSDETETIFKIAERYNLDPQKVISDNPNLSSWDVSKGQVLRLLLNSPITIKGDKVVFDNKPAPTASARAVDAELPKASATNKASAGNYHIVKSKENLTSIAREYGVSVDKLKKLNDLKTNKIIIGQKILLPEATKTKGVPQKKVAPQVTAVKGGEHLHIVQEGDTLYSIAKSYNVSIKTIQELNNFQGTKIWVQQRLKL